MPRDPSVSDLDLQLERARQLLAGTNTVAAVEAANQVINVALRLHPHHAGAWLVKCQVMSAHGDDLAALAAVEVAVRRAPRRAEAHYWRGAILADLARYPEALTALARAFALAGERERWLLEDLYYEKGHIYQRLGDPEQARLVFAAGVEACPASLILRDALEPMLRAQVRGGLRVLRGGLG